MEKIRLGVIFGGMSTENEVSVVSGTSVLKNLNKEKYELYPIYIDKLGIWYEYKEDFNKNIDINYKITNIEKIENINEYLKKLNVIFPVLHGLYGEDGTIQGLFEMLKIPYVGCKVLSSSVGMDKAYTKIIFEKANIKQAKYVYVKKYKESYIHIDNEFNEKRLDSEELCELCKKELNFPMFVKPSNSGSSVGINKAENEKELKEYIEYASTFDNKILIEEGIIGRELECAVLGNEEPIASCIGEVAPAEEFYSYNAKYNNSQSRTIIPAEISEEKANEIKELAKKAFKAIDGNGLSRVDFFMQDSTQQIYINEINTLPGFTKISMYPKLFEQIGIKYEVLLDNLINLAIQKNK